MTDTTDTPRPMLVHMRELMDLVTEALGRAELTPYHVKISANYSPPEVEVYLDSDDRADVRRLASELGEAAPMTERTEQTTRYNGRRVEVEYFHIDSDRDRAQAEGAPYFHLWASRSTPILEGDDEQ